MFLNDISSSPKVVFKKINDFLDLNYGYTIPTTADCIQLDKLQDQILEDIDQLKLEGHDAKSSPNITQRLLILEGIRTLKESIGFEMKSPQLDSVVENMSKRVVDSFLVGGVCEQDFEDALAEAMREYRSSVYRFPDETVESMVRQSAISQLEEMIIGTVSGKPDQTGEVDMHPVDSSEVDQMQHSITPQPDEYQSSDLSDFDDFDLNFTTTREQGTIMNEKKEIIKSLRRMMESQVSQAQVMMAAKGFAQELQEMVEKVGRLQNEDLPPVTDQMRETYGTDSASTFQTQIYSALQSVMDSLYTAKNQIDDAVESLATSGRIGSTSDMDQDIPELDSEQLPDEGNMGGDTPELDLDLDNLEGEEEPSGELGREKKMESVIRLEKKIMEMRTLINKAKRLKEAR